MFDICVWDFNEVFDVSDCDVVDFVFFDFFCSDSVVCVEFVFDVSNVYLVVLNGFSLEFVMEEVVVVVFVSCFEIDFFKM